MASAQPRLVTIPYSPRPQFVPYHNRTQRWSCMVVHRRGGKALDVATMIPMVDGSWKRMGDLVQGDLVFDETGAPCRVVAAHPVQIGRPCYSVKFSDGAEVTCDEDHLWLTQTKLDRAAHTAKRKGPRGAVKYVSRDHSPRDGTVKTTAEICATLNYQGERNHSIPLAGALQYPAQETPIDAYVLGLWLGDGTSRNGHVTTMDEEIVVALQAYAGRRGYDFHAVHSTNTGRATTYSLAGQRMDSFTQELRKLGLLQNKHIPDAYKASAVRHRIALLQGLMDTDGSIGERSKCEITQKRFDLANDIVTLLRGLGVKASLREKTVSGVSYWRVTFRPWFNPFRLGRKSERFSSAHKTRAHSQKRFIVSVDPVETRPVRCITVDSPSRLYLCSEHLVPTHNTVATINDLLKTALTCTKPNPRVAYVAPQFNQAKDVAWGYVHEFAGVIPGVQFNEAELRCDLPNGGRLRLYGADNYERLRGIYLDDVALDEYADMDPRAWSQVIRPALTDREGRATFIGTPKGANGFKDIWDEAGSDPEWFRLMLKASESGILAPAELISARRRMTEDEYEQEFECSFSAAVQGAFYAKDLTLADQQRRIGRVPHAPELPVHTAWDLGIDDATAIWFYQVAGQEIRVIGYYETSGQGLPDIVRDITDYGKERRFRWGDHYLPHDVEVRELGTGRSRKETLQQLGLDVYVVPNIGLVDGINSTRMIIARCWFDAEECKAGLNALRLYRREFDEKRKVFIPRPLHDFTSHAADAFRMLGVAYRSPRGYYDEDHENESRRTANRVTGY